MAEFRSDGKKLIDVEYDVRIETGDMLDGMRVLFVHNKGVDEYCVFLLETLSRKIVCYVFDEIYIIGKSNEFDNLQEAVEAWKNNEI